MLKFMNKGTEDELIKALNNGQLEYIAKITQTLSSLTFTGKTFTQEQALLLVLGLKNSTTLRELSFFNCCFINDSFRHIANLVSCTRTIQKLKIHGESLSAKDINLLSKSMNASLKHLTLTKSIFSSQEMIEIARIAGCTTTLRSFALGKCAINYPALNLLYNNIVNSSAILIFEISEMSPVLSLDYNRVQTMLRSKRRKKIREDALKSVGTQSSLNSTQPHKTKAIDIPEHVTKQPFKGRLRCR